MVNGENSSYSVNGEVDSLLGSSGRVPSLARLTADRKSWIGQHFLSVRQLDIGAINLFLKEAQAMRALVAKQGGDLRLQGRILGNIFFEPSTRTASSFQVAFQVGHTVAHRDLHNIALSHILQLLKRLGGSVVHVDELHSSAQKGETLNDTVTSLSCYCDITVVRHPRKGSVRIAAASCPRPLINAGDGVGEHPTQSLLDLLTIHSECKGGVVGKSIALVGDLKHGRTAHSLVRLLCLFEGVKLTYVSPESLRMPEDEQDYVAHRRIPQKEVFGLDSSVMAETDVLYMTRVQKERFANPEEYDAVKDLFKINTDVMAMGKQSLVLMHPLPRVGEIEEAVDQDPRAAYFRQMENGMYARMALIALMLGKAGP